MANKMTVAQVEEAVTKVMKAFEGARTETAKDLAVDQYDTLSENNAEIGQAYDTARLKALRRHLRERIVGSRTGAVPRRLPLAVSAVSSFVPV